MSDSEGAGQGQHALFLLSFRQRDELAAVAAGAGWRVVAARRGEGADRRLLASGAAIAVIDARGALDEGLAAARLVGPRIAADGGALLVLVSQSDAAQIGAFHDAGATHFLASPMRETEFVQALRFAARHVERVRGGIVPAMAGQGTILGWRYDPKRRTLQFTPQLAELTGLGETPSPRAALAMLEGEDRRLARAAFRRLASGVATAFAHDFPGGGRVVEHLHLDGATGRLHAIVERLTPGAQAAAMLRDTLPVVRDAAAARRWLATRRDAGAPIAAALVALAQFERINDSVGRSTGDSLLRGAMRRIEGAVEERLGRAALVARLTGPEFVVLAQTDAAAMHATAERIAEALRQPLVADGKAVALGPRIATSVHQSGEELPDALRRLGVLLADVPPGGGIVRDEGGPALDRLATELAGAMERGEIAVLFQPQVSVTSGAIAGVEALARWAHPELGELGAETLFAAALRAELERPLSEHVQRRALAEAAEWPPELRTLRLSINVTAGDIASPDFADRLIGRIDASGFPRHRLTVEITETGLIEELGEAARLLGSLRAAGCRTAIDDFGTGYSSLAYLKALPLDYLKIDRRLSQDIEGAPRDRVVIRGVIDMARSLGLTVIAEGVETETQLALLAAAGCQLYQGFLCAPPITAAALAALMRGR